MPPGPSPRLLLPLLLALPAPLAGQNRLLPLGDSITAGALGGPNSEHFRGGYRYFLERFLEGSEGGPAGFTFTGSTAASGFAKGTIASYAGQWYPHAKPLNHPLNSGYPGYSIEQIDALVADDTIPVASSDVILLQIGTNNIGTSNTTPATPADISSWTLAYQSLLDHILTKNPAAKVIMAKIPPVTTGWVMGNIGVNTARIEPFNNQVVEPVYQAYRIAHPGQFFLVDNYAPLDPLNLGDSWATATNDHDFFTGTGDGVHPYNAGHRKFAASFWRVWQLAKGAAAADLVTVNDGTGGADAFIRGNGSTLGGATETTQPYVHASNNPADRGKYYLKLDLSGKPKNWDHARFNLIFWGAPDGPASFGNCCDNAPAATTLQLFGIADGGDDWTEAAITWANAPGNDTAGNSVAGTFLGELVIPAGTQTGDIISVTSEALRNFVNYQRGADGRLTFAVVGFTPDPGFLPTFQDSDFRDYAPAFLQLTLDSLTDPPADFRILSSTFDLAAVPNPRVTVTFRSSEAQLYLLSASTDMLHYDQVLASDLPGATGQSHTTVTIDLPAQPMPPHLFLRVEPQ